MTVGDAPVPAGKRRVLSFRTTHPGASSRKRNDAEQKLALTGPTDVTVVAPWTANEPVERDERCRRSSSVRQQLRALLEVARLSVDKRRRHNASLKALRLLDEPRGDCRTTLYQEKNQNQEQDVKEPKISAMFAAIGTQIARHPYIFILVGLLSSLLSLGMLRMQLKDRIRDGYTPENAPSRYETLVMREFWNASADPIMTILLVQARDDGNVMRLPHVAEAARLSRYLMHDFQLAMTPAMAGVAPTDHSHVTYAEICDPFCDANLPLETFATTLEDEIGQLQSSNSSEFGPPSLTYPVAKIHGYSVYLERMFFGVTLNNGSGSEEGKTPEQIVTNMDSVKVMMLLFRGDRSSPAREAALSAWELAVYDYLHYKYHSEYILVEAIGTEILDREMLEDGQKLMPFFAGGFLATVLFVFITVLGQALCTRTFDAGKIWCATATVVSPSLAIALTYGIVSLLGLRVNSFLLILPYLVFGIGVDDGFLIMHAWFKASRAARQIAGTPRQRVAAERTDALRLAGVLAEVGPSISVTTLTNVISFAVGAFSPTPEIRLFCFGTTLALALVFVLQFLFLCPVLELTKRFETRVLTINGAEDSAALVERRLDDYAMDAPEKTVQAPSLLPAAGESDAPAADNVGSIAPGIISLTATTVTAATSTTTGTASYSGSETTGRYCCWNRLLGVAFEHYCALLQSRVFALLLTVIMAAYCYAAVTGTLQIRTRLDASKVLPSGSRIQRTNLVLDQCVWNDYHSVNVLVNKEFDLTNEAQVRDFDRMVDEFERLPKCRGSLSSMNWLRDYRTFLAAGNDEIDTAFDMLGLFSDLVGPSENRPELEAPVNAIKDTPASIENESSGSTPTETDNSASFDSCRLIEFLDSSFRRHWNGFLHYVEPEADPAESLTDRRRRCPRITRFMLTVAYHETATWEDRIALMLQWREIAGRYRDSLNATVWEQNSMFVDQMLSLKTTTIQSGSLTLCCMIVICALFVSNPFSVMIASLVIASICIGVFGFLSFMDFDLDPITMAALLMSIGLSVDYTAHVVYHFQQNNRVEMAMGGASRRVPLTNRADKLRHTLRAVGWPLVQAAVSTALCVLPLVFVKKYAASVFFSTICVVTALGLIHGLVVLPCLLVHLPAFCSSANFYAVYCTTTARKSYAPKSAAVPAKDRPPQFEPGLVAVEKIASRDEFLI